MTKQKKASKVTTGHKITLGALSIMGFAAGWNAIGREVNQAAASQETTVAVQSTAVPLVVAPGANPTPWPTIPPLAANARLVLKPVPTLVAVAMWPEQPVGSVAGLGGPASQGISALPSIAPLPTLAPMPAMPEYVAPPPAPAPPPQVAAAPPPPPPSGGGDVSKGS